MPDFQGKGRPGEGGLQALLADESADVRVVAAEAIAYMGGSAAAVKTVADVLKSGNPYEVLAAQNALDFMWHAGHVTLPEAKRLTAGTKSREPGNRIPRYLLDQP